MNGITPIKDVSEIDLQNFNNKPLYAFNPNIDPDVNMAMSIEDIIQASKDFDERLENAMKLMSATKKARLRSLIINSDLQNT